jgi:hypothetical protein
MLDRVGMPCESRDISEGPFGPHQCKLVLATLLVPHLASPTPVPAGSLCNSSKRRSMLDSGRPLPTRSPGVPASHSADLGGRRAACWAAVALIPARRTGPPTGTSASRDPAVGSRNRTSQSPRSSATWKLRPMQRGRPPGALSVRRGGRFVPSWRYEAGSRRATRENGEAGARPGGVLPTTSGRPADFAAGTRRCYVRV